MSETNYVEILNELNQLGLTQYRISKETGLSCRTLKRLQDGIIKDPRVSTHNHLVRLLSKARRTNRGGQL